MIDLAKGSRASSGNWLLWWRIGAGELRDQVKNYDKLKIYQSARGISLLLFVGAAALTVLFTELINHNRLSYIDAACFVFLGIFIYLGHRWAMMAGMVLWTLEKALQLAAMVMTRRFANPVTALLFWALFMHAMFLAYRVEQERRKAPPTDVEVFN
jgi:hypothetical protein